MTELVTELKTEIETLSSILLSTLDESIFFSELSKFLLKNTETNRVLIYQILNDSSARLVANSGKKVKQDIILGQGVGTVGYVARTKKAYFSNNIAKDPLFAGGDIEGINAELCVPINCNGTIIGTIHLQIEDEVKQFDREDITNVLEILKQIELPLSNMNMYLSAKFLNESLIKQVEAKEKELEERKLGGLQLGYYSNNDSKILGKSEVLVRVLKMSDRVALTDSHFLMEGKTGCGKEMIARRVHCNSSRKEKQFQSFDCSLYDENQLEIELFGQESGELTGKINIRPGMIEATDGGTIFITNIDKLSLSLQSKLNNYITQKMCFRVGGQVPYRSDSRIIASSSKDILKLVEDDKFREDLYYSIGTVILKVPSLSKRTDDIEVLATHFLNLGRSISEEKSLSPGVLKTLIDYSWPGNIRELRSSMERAYILSEGKIIEKEHLSENIINSDVKEDTNKSKAVYTFAEMTLNELEQKHICQTLEKLSGNKTRTAKTLGITVKTLYNKLHSYGMIIAKEA